MMKHVLKILGNHFSLTLWNLARTGNFRKKTTKFSVNCDYHKWNLLRRFAEFGFFISLLYTCFFFSLSRSIYSHIVFFASPFLTLCSA